MFSFIDANIKSGETLNVLLCAQVGRDLQLILCVFNVKKADLWLCDFNQKKMRMGPVSYLITGGDVTYRLPNVNFLIPERGWWFAEHIFVKLVLCNNTTI